MTETRLTDTLNPNTTEDFINKYPLVPSMKPMRVHVQHLNSNLYIHEKDHFKNACTRFRHLNQSCAIVPVAGSAGPPRQTPDTQVPETPGYRPLMTPTGQQNRRE